LVAAALNKQQLLKVAQRLPELGPMELDRILAAFAKTSDDEIGQALVEALEQSDATGDLVPDKLVVALKSFGPDVAKAAKPLLDRPQADAAERRAMLDSMLSSVGKGDARRGHAIFQSSKAACATCHAVGYL